jgi:hypothetical protein
MNDLIKLDFYTVSYFPMPCSTNSNSPPGPLKPKAVSLDAAPGEYSDIAGG